MFTQEEKQYIVNALDEEVKRTGLRTAAFALGILTKLQQPDPEPVPTPLPGDEEVDG